MKKSKKIRGLCLLLCGAMLFVLPGCGTKKYVPEPESVTSKTTEYTEESSAPISEPDRVSNEKQVEELKKQYQQNPSDQAVTLEYAKKLFALGDFSESKEMLKPLLEVEKPLPDAIYLSAQIEYLNGNYTQSEKLYNTLVKQYPDEFKEKAEAGLVMTYYQTNQYPKANQLSTGQDEVNNSIVDMMKAFGEDAPYQLDWNSQEETLIPFVVTNPLPVVPIEINGKRINAFIDTGAPMFVVDEAIAAELGIKSASGMKGEFAGGNTAEISFGRADSLRIGDVNIQNIPVMLGSFEGFANTFKDSASDVHGIIGTNVLQQFVATMDYPSGQLILRPRSETGHQRVNEMLTNDTVLEEMPFTLALTHNMFAKGSINQKSGLNFFVDSGLALPKSAMTLPKETMDLLGIPIPKLTPALKGVGGMGGSDYEEGSFDLSEYGLGNLQLKNGIGDFTTGETVPYYDEAFGFFQDGLISHNYLKNYKWTIDFDSMKMIFSERK